MSWQALAGYLYVLRLDGPSLAWEYLRRNKEYRTDWNQRSRENCDPVSRWHLEVFEDPNLDARLARPVWRLARHQRIRLQAAHPMPDELEVAPRFSLWDIPGAKRLVHDGRHTLFTGSADGEALHLALGQDIRDGAPFDFVISPGAQMDEASRAVERHRRLAAGKRTPVPAVSGRPGRLALLHKRALQAFDGGAAGTSQREIARHVYGAEPVVQNWNPDSELRARVRHLLRRARAFVDGGYRDLISKSSEGR
ncbi:DUF2285 domain-containing protein [Caenimonas soli]|uniref:DUF2285 domain-containing protein n=1 Tax=Caenimonas soli TaxID=2735555 RepID=UPI0015576478|nr:DUF2285 domain-containing protein [Caenimonas soli]NPC57796.1 DUF2285 domain-containing protein [Caenimonas soli]